MLAISSGELDGHRIGLPVVSNANQKEITLRALRIQVTRKPCQLKDALRAAQSASAKDFLLSQGVQSFSRPCPLENPCCTPASQSHLRLPFSRVTQIGTLLRVAGLHLLYWEYCDLLQVSRSNSWKHKPRTGKGKTGTLLLSICDFNGLYFQIFNKEPPFYSPTKFSHSGNSIFPTLFRDLKM